MILIIDNYDSFTYNVVQTIGAIDPGIEVVVVRNDKATVDELLAMGPERLIVSPGPCTPAEAGISVAAIRAFAGVVPVLGICLGHQSIGEAFGGRTVRAGRLMHGKTSPVFHDGKGVFAGLPSPFEAMRYHSLVIDGESMPACLEVTARTDRDEIMAVRHRDLPVEGVQFHPESIMTTVGADLLRNFIAPEYPGSIPSWEAKG